MPTTLPRQNTSKGRREHAKADSAPTYQARREEIIAAAGRAFLIKGFDATSFRDIAEAVGVDRASLYYYFSSKQDLFHIATSAAVARNVREAERVARSDVSSLEKVDQILSQLLESYTKTDYPYMFIFLQEDVNRISDDPSEAWAREMNALTRRYERALSRIISEGVEQGTFEDVAPPHVLAKALIGMANWTHRWYREDGRMSAADIANAFTRVFLGGVCTPAARRRL